MYNNLVSIPRGTRLSAIVTHEEYTDVWIALQNAHDKVSEWRGTYLRLFNNGKVTRITDDGTTYDEFDVRSARKGG